MRIVALILTPVFTGRKRCYMSLVQGYIVCDVLAVVFAFTISYLIVTLTLNLRVGPCCNNRKVSEGVHWQERD